jgi:hypothetical protein
MRAKAERTEFALAIEAKNIIVGKWNFPCRRHCRRLSLRYATKLFVIVNRFFLIWSMVRSRAVPFSSGSAWTMRRETHIR